MEGDEPSYCSVSQEKCPSGKIGFLITSRRAFRSKMILLSLIAFLLLASAQAALIKVGTYDTPGIAQCVAIGGTNYAWVADGNSGLQIIDISDPTNPKYKNARTDLGSVLSLTVSWVYIYAIADTYLYIILGDPKTAQVYGTYNSICKGYSVAVSGNYAYLVDEWLGLQIIDVRNKNDPKVEGFYRTDGYAHDVAVSGNYAYLANYTSGLCIIDISTPDSPKLAGIYDTPGHACGVAVSGNYAYVADGSSGLQIIDVRTPTSPKLAGNYNTPGYACDVAVSGNYAYVADGNFGLKVIDVSTPTSPKLAGSYNTPGYAFSMAVSGNYIYVADGNSGLQIIAEAATIDGTVWDDRNNNGIQDAGEMGVENVQVDLLNSTGYPLTPVQVDGQKVTTRTSAVGKYQFTVPPGRQYRLNFTLPSGKAFSLKDQGGDDSLDSDVDPTTGMTNPIAATPGSSYKNIDAGLVSLAVSGRVWDDQNYDGLQDAGETALQGISVELLDENGNSFSPATTNSTDSKGNYSFSPSMGSYHVKFTLPSGKLFSPQDQGGDDSLDSDADPASGQTVVIAISQADGTSVQDAGMYENKIVINEIYPNPVGSDNQEGTASWERVELKNTGSSDCNIGGWTIKDDDNPHPTLATIPSGTMISAGGYLVLHIGSSSVGISNDNGDPVILSNSAGIDVDRVDCPPPSNCEGLGYSCLPDATENWGFWGEPTLGGDLGSSSLPGAANMALDWGDAPDTYSTTRSNSGPHHLVTGLCLGTKIDHELDGLPGVNADGDDITDEDDEDGATFSNGFIAGLSSSFNVTASALGVFQAWIDFNGDGDFGDSGEQISSDVTLTAGESTINFAVPSDAKAGYTYARLRFSSSSGLSYTGLAADGEVEDYRIEIKPQYLLGDFVWEDLDGDGLQDANEPGLDGIAANIRDGADSIVASNTTVGGGNYFFVNPSPGTYTLEFVAPTGYNFTAINAGSDDGIDSDVDPVTRRTGRVTVVLEQSNLTIDAGMYRPGSISGVKFNDKNASGFRDAGEPGLSGWTIYLDLDKDDHWDNVSTPGYIVEPFDVTDSSGGYSFSDLAPGDYRVSEVAQDGWIQSCPATSFYDETLVSGQIASNLDFGNRVVSGLSVGGKKTNETGIAVKGWNITLTGITLDGAAVSLKATTAVDGSYSFTSLSAGRYTVAEESKAGWEVVGPASYTLDLTASKSDANFVNRLVSGLSVGGKKTNETGVAKKDWNITLTGTTLDGSAVSLNATTAVDGSYSFTGLFAGSYTVSEETKVGWEAVGPASYTLDLTASKSDVNFVNRLVSGLSVSGKKANETGVAVKGWNITLTGTTFDGTAVSLKSTTADDGSYSFTGLFAGSYTVAEEAKTGWEAVGPASYSFALTASTSNVNFVNQIASGLCISGKKTNETGAAVKDWNITLIGTTLYGAAVSLNATTADDGSYSFTGLFAGSYTVAEEAKVGWEVVGPASYTFDLVASKSDVDFVNRVVSGLSISGKKINETGAAKKDWNITLTGTTLDGVAVSRKAVTAIDGSYSFTGLFAGGYTVAEESKAGWQSVGPASYSFSLMSGSINVDFINQIISGLAISGRLATNSGVAKSGWNISLSGTTVDGNAVTKETATASDGSYSFTGLLAGDYIVTCESRTQWPVIDPATRSHSISLRFTDSTDNDFTIMLSVSISGSKFEDKDGNGIWDSGEPGLAGWTITLERPGWANNTTTTAANGNYSFIDLPEGSWTLSEVEQYGWARTAPASGTYFVDLTDAGVTNIDFGNRRKAAGMTVNMTADPITVFQGNAVTLTTIVDGSGAILPESLDVLQLLPSGLTFVSAAPPVPQSTTVNPNGTTTLLWSDLAPSSDRLAELVVQTTVDPDATSTLKSSVQVNGESSQAFITGASDDAEITVMEQLLPVTLTKTSDLDEVAEGSYITYAIGYESNVAVDLTGVVITEHVPADLEFVSASPSPDGGTENVWTLGTLAGKASGEITILYLVKNRANLSYESESQVTGSGYVNVRRSLSTETNTLITNSVTLSCNEFAPVSTSYSVNLLDAEGTALLEKEHGSGEYESEELLSLKMQNRSIRTEGSLQASYRPTSFALPAGRMLDYDSELAASQDTRNRATYASTSQSFRYAKSIDLDRKLLIDRNETDLAIEAKVQGQAHLGAFKKDGVEAKSSPVFESAADYQGRFAINSSLEDYGVNVRMAGNATGSGRTEKDLRLKKSQRSFEHGNGSYEQEEIVSTPESYIAKDVNASYNAGEEYGNGKWTSGIWSKSSGSSLLGQEISEADYIREETTAGGLSDMETNASFQGQGRFRAISEPDNRSAVDLNEQYVGEYTISRKVHLGGVSHFDRPHITLVKEGMAVERSTLVDYHITILNDGNAALGPVYVWDPFPAGTDYVSASIKPTVLKSDSINWTLLYLGIGQTVSIDLRLNITDPRDALINRVYASGGHHDEGVFASNMSALQVGWLGCCSGSLETEMQARIDLTDPHIIWYRIYLQNPSNTSMAAQVTTTLSLGLTLLNASIEPQQFGQNLNWVTEAIAPGEGRIIEYRARALSDGRFESTATVESHPLDGSEGASSSVAASIVVGNETTATHPEDGWKPPEWGLDRSDVFDSIFESVAGDERDSSSCEGGSCPI